jgi:transketolase
METLLARGRGEAFVDLTAPQSFPSLVGDTETLRRRAGLDPASIAGRARALVAGRGAPLSVGLG